MAPSATETETYTVPITNTKLHFVSEVGQYKELASTKFNKETETNGPDAAAVIDSSLASHWS